MTLNNQMTRQQRRVWTRKMKEAGTRFDKHGCAVCRTPWTPVEVVVLTPAGDFAICCAPCAYASGRQIVGLAASSSEAITHGTPDRDWFAANPGCDWRMRDPMAGELHTLAEKERLLMAAATGEDEPLDLPEFADPQIIAVQLEPGRRARVVVERGTSVTRHLIDDVKSRIASSSSSDLATQQWAACAAPLVAVESMIPSGGRLLAQAKAQGEGRWATKH